MITTIFWDIDNTLLNFYEAEKAAIRSCFKVLNLGECTDAMLTEYSAINKQYWLRLERGELTKQDVLLGRFKEFFHAYGLPEDQAAPFNDIYQVKLGDTVVYMENSYELLTKLKEKGYRQYAATNGTIVAQNKKLAGSGFDKILNGKFISDELGADKPSAAFFDRVFESLGDIDRGECIIVGDSLTSDIKGANNAGIKGCWYNPWGLENRTDSVPDYEIAHLWDLEKILETINGSDTVF